MAHIYAPQLNLAAAAQGTLIWTESADPGWWDVTLQPPPIGTEIITWNGMRDFACFDGRQYLRREDEMPIEGVTHYAYPPADPE